MAIWTRRAGGADSVSPIEHQVIDDLAAPGADADALIAETLAEARTHARVARNRADEVVIGFTLGAEVDALTTDIARFERGGDDRADLLAVRELDARARHLGNEALAQQRKNGVRTVTGLAGIYLSTEPPRER